jgi:hypothetical protein
MDNIMKSFLNYLNESILLEDKEGKNINRAEKWIKENHPEVIGKKLEDGTTITPRILTQEIRNTIPNVRMCDCKFLVGTTRFYFEG